LVIIGGAEDKLGHRRILRRFVSLSGGTDAVVAVCATASSLGDEITDLYEKVFYDLGAREVLSVRPINRAEADAPVATKAIHGASGVFFTGGNQARLAGVLRGTALGDRFVLLAGESLAMPHVHLDYARPLPPCLSAAEDGLVTLVKQSPDLLIRPQLDRWSERAGDTTWRLTEQSVAAAVKAGGSIERLLALLRERQTHALPPVLEVALRAWAGRRPPVALAAVTVLRCTQPQVFAAIAGSPMLAPYLRGALAPDTLLVETARLAELRERLAWAGLAVSDEL